MFFNLVAKANGPQDPGSRDPTFFQVCSRAKTLQHEQSCNSKMILNNVPVVLSIDTNHNFFYYIQTEY